MNAKRLCMPLVSFMALATFGVGGAFANPTAHGIGDGTQLSANALVQWQKSQDVSQISQADIERLSSHVLWRRLLFYPDVAHKNDKSGIQDDTFFLSKTGKYSPKDELVALLTAMRTGDGDGVCRFPARVAFVRQHLPDLPSLTCDEFERWAGHIGAKALSVVFAEEHGDNIAGAFAHVFMRIDGRDDDELGQFATAMNYTVNANRQDGLMSAIKPLTGGYVGVMEIMPYLSKQQDYLVKDERDLWQYRLDLSDDEMTQILRHLWEVQQLKRPYYLTHDNCATEIMRLIDVVRDDDNLSAKAGLITTPAKMVQVLSKANLVVGVRYLPSASTTRQAHQNAKNQASQANQNIVPTKPSDNNPALASPMHRVGVGLSQIDGRVREHISVRTAYHDGLDKAMGVRKFHDLVLPSIELVRDDDKVRLGSLTVFHHTKLNPANTAKALKDSSGKALPSSRLSLGWTMDHDASDDDNQEHLVFGTSVQKGVAWSLGKAEAGTGELADGVCYALAGVSGQLGRLNQGYRAGVMTTLGCQYHANDRLRVQGELSLPFWYHHGTHKNSYLQPKTSIGVQYDLSRRHAIRLNWQRQYHKNANDGVRGEWFWYF